MPLTKIREIRVQPNLESFRGEIPVGAVGDAGDIAIGLNPNKQYHIHVTKPTDGAEVFITNTAMKKAGGRITDLDDADIMWRSISNGTGELFTGAEKGVTGMKIVSAVDPTTVAINYSVIQTK